MPNQYYSPNAKISGGCLFATFNSKDGAIYLKFLKQIANNADKKGNFDGKNPINIKLSQDEAADIIRAVRSNGSAKFYHKFDKGVSSGEFKHYTIPAKDNSPARSGFGYSVKRTIGDDALEVKMGFTLGSAERFSLFLQNALVHIFDAEYSQDLKDFRDSQAKKAAAEEKPSKKEKQPETPEASNDDLPEPPLEDTTASNLDF